MIADLANGSPSEPAMSFSAHEHGVNSVEFSPDGAYLASGGNDGVVRIWDVQKEQKVTNIIGGTYSITGVAFNPGGDLLALVNGDVIRLREIETERIWGTLLAPTNLYSLAYRPDGGLLASGDIENNVYLWNPQDAYRSGVETYPEPLVLRGHDGDLNNYHSIVWRVAFHPHGNLLVSAGGDGTVRLWNVTEATLVDTLRGHSAGVTSLAFSPDGGILASGGLDGVVYFWDVAPYASGE